VNPAAIRSKAEGHRLRQMTYFERRAPHPRHLTQIAACLPVMRRRAGAGGMVAVSCPTSQA
jgi:hypothetical protein